MKKGFTLIELLAVIVILAIIAVIAVPIVLNIINDSKESAVLRSAQFYLDGLEQSLLLSRLNNIKVQDDVYSIMQDGNICIGEFKDNTCDGDILKVEMDGEVPTEGTIKIKNGEVSKIDITISNKEVWIDPFTNKLEYKLAPGLYDENDKLLMSWDELVTNYDFENLVESDHDPFDEGDTVASIIESIGEDAYKLVIDKTVEKIGDEAFYRSVYLKSVIIPSSVTEIGHSAFGVSELIQVVIPSSVTEIPNRLFEGCSDLAQVIIEGDVTSIGEYAFQACEGLTSITIPESVTSIGDSAFSGWTGLTSITIPESVTSIGEYAFQSCSSLTSITIPNSVTSIGNEAFAECTNLTTIYYKETVPEEKWGALNATVVNNF